MKPEEPQVPMAFLKARFLRDQGRPDPRQHFKAPGVAKESWLFESTARAAARNRAKKATDLKPGETIGAYRCQVCKRWHIGRNRNDTE